MSYVYISTPHHTRSQKSNVKGTAQYKVGINATSANFVCENVDFIGMEQSCNECSFKLNSREVRYTVNTNHGKYREMMNSLV